MPASRRTHYRALESELSKQTRLRTKFAASSIARIVGEFRPSQKYDKVSIDEYRHAVLNIGPSFACWARSVVGEFRPSQKYDKVSIDEYRHTVQRIGPGFVCWARSVVGEFRPSQKYDITSCKRICPMLCSCARRP